jgi:hypothetical protein
MSDPYPDFECPHCKHGVSYSEKPDLLEGMGWSNTFTYECECGASFKVHVDWDPDFYVDADTLALPAVVPGEGGVAS